MAPLTDWIINKIVNHLVSKEGCKQEPNTMDGQGRVVIQDAFGYRYQVTVKPLSRVDNNVMDESKSTFFLRKL